MSSPEPPTEPQLPPPQEPTPRRLTRASSDRYVGGVAGGLGRYFGVDPILFRIGFAVLTVAGGAGALAYLGLWLLVPDEHGRGVSSNRVATVAGALVLGLAILWLLPDGGGFWWFFPPGLFGLIVLIGTGVLIHQAARGGLPGSAVARGLVIAAAVVGAVMLGVGAAVAAAFGGGTAVAIVVIALGAVMVVTSFTGGRRWLLLPALALAAPLAFVAAADLEIDGGVGDREYDPQTIGEVRDLYRLGVGEMWIDLRDVDFPDGSLTTINVEMGLGTAHVLLPEPICAGLDVRAGIGAVKWFDESDGGVDIDVERTAPLESGVPRVRIVGDVDIGTLQVSHDPDEFGRQWHRLDRPRGPFDDDLDLDEAPMACPDTT